MLDFLDGTPFQFLNETDPQLLAIAGTAIVALFVILIVLRRRGKERNEIFCPYCLSRVPKAATCVNEDCQEKLHPLYRENSHAGDIPLLVSVVGFSGHGKTVYLASLLHAMSNQLPSVWNKFFRRSLDQNAIDNLRRNMSILNEGKLPDSTRLNFPKPSIHQLLNMQRFGTRTVALYDPPGEAFETGERIEKYASFIARSKAVFFLVSLEDLDASYGDEMARLLETYTLGLTALAEKRQPQHLIVVFTKADALIDTAFADLPELIDYLDQDEPMQLANLTTYAQKIQQVSEMLRDVLVTKMSASNFIHYAEAQFKSVTYTAVSALGSPPILNEEGDAELSVAMQPRRVLDPLLVAMEKV